MLLGVNFAHLVDHEVLFVHLGFLLNPLVILGGQLREFFDLIDISSVLISEITQLQVVRPIALIQVCQHSLFKLTLSVVDRNRVVIAIQTVSKGHIIRLFQMTDV